MDEYDREARTSRRHTFDGATGNPIQAKESDGWSCDFGFE